MPDLDIKIGGRTFQVSCQAGEEHYLQAAAAALDREAEPLQAQLGRLPEARMLLMAGLMVADRTAALEDEVKALKAKLAERGETVAAAPVVQSVEVPVVQRVEVPVVPQALRDSLAEIAARTETLAQRWDDVGS
jgi:cell division protein ZapA